MFRLSPHVVLLFSFLAAVSSMLASCGPKGPPASPTQKDGVGDTEWTDPESFLPSSKTTAPHADPLRNDKAPLIAITSGTVMTAAGQVHAPGMVVLRGGSIQSVGPFNSPSQVPDGARVIDATGKFVTPGIKAMKHSTLIS